MTLRLSFHAFSSSITIHGNCVLLNSKPSCYILLLNGNTILHRNWGDNLQLYIKKNRMSKVVPNSKRTVGGIIVHYFKELSKRQSVVLA